MVPSIHKVIYGSEQEGLEVLQVSIATLASGVGWGWTRLWNLDCPNAYAESVPGNFQASIGHIKRVLAFGASSVCSIGSGCSEGRYVRAYGLPLGYGCHQLLTARPM
jgi:hypothetical protein